MKSLAIIMAFCLIFAIMPQNKVYSSNNVLYVGGSGEGNYSSIQDAINNASNGDTIIVYPGIYEENIVVDKSVKLIGMNREKTIIDGCKKGFVVKIMANGVTIKNFTMRNSGYSHAAIYVTSDENCIMDNKIEYANGISFYKSSYNIVRENVFANLNGSYPCSAIFMRYSSNNSIFKNKIEGKDVAIYASSSWDSAIYENEIYNSSGIVCEQCSNFSIRNNIIKNGNMIGIEIAFSQHVKATNNKIYNITGTLEQNGVATPAGVGVIVGYSHDILIEANLINSTNFTGIASVYSKCIIFNNKILNIYGLRESKGITYPIGAGIIIEFCDDSMIQKNILENTNFGGIILYSSKNGKIEENEIRNINGYRMEENQRIPIGVTIAMLDVENASIENNIIRDCDDGILAMASSGTIHENEFINISCYAITGEEKQRMGYGTIIFESESNVSNNIFINNSYSINFFASKNFAIIGNKIKNDETGESGIMLYFARNGKILNNRVENTISGITLFSSNKIEMRNNSLHNIMNLLLIKSNRNRIENNFFVKEKGVQAFFIDCSFNLWLRNYWNNWHAPIPKPIFGIKIVRGITIPWVNFDWMPSTGYEKSSPMPLSHHLLINQSASFHYHILQHHLPQHFQFYTKAILEMHDEILLHFPLQQSILYCFPKIA